MQRLALLLCVLAILTPALPVQAQTANDPLAIHSPGPGAVVGGLVSVLGTAEVPDMESYQLSFGPGAEPAQWIPIGQARNDAVRDGRLALWDTTGIPDGSYTLGWITATSMWMASRSATRRGLRRPIRRCSPRRHLRRRSRPRRRRPPFRPSLWTMASRRISISP